MRKQKGIAALAVCFMLMFPVTSFSQGAWNLDYILSDSLTASLVGKEVRIDFSSPHDIPIVKRLNIRRMLAREDTVDIPVGDRLVRYVEQWRIYPDHGVLQEQFLTSIDKTTSIREIYVDAIGDSSVTFTLTLLYAAIPDQRIQIYATIPRSQIRGLLARH